MNTIRPAPVLLCIILFAMGCNQAKRGDVPSSKNTAADVGEPAALQPASEVSVFRSRGGDNLLAELYEDSVKKNPGLIALEALLKKLPSLTSDSLAAYREYKSKNENYYNEVGAVLGEIKDSDLRKRISKLVDLDIKRWHIQTTTQDTFADSLGRLETAVADYHRMLEIMVTLPIINRYQQAHLPSPTPMKSAIGQYNKAIGELQAGVNKE